MGTLHKNNYVIVHQIAIFHPVRQCESQVICSYMYENESIAFASSTSISETEITETLVIASIFYNNSNKNIKRIKSQQRWQKRIFHVSGGRDLAASEQLQSHSVSLYALFAIEFYEMAGTVPDALTAANYETRAEPGSEKKWNMEAKLFT